MYFMNKLVIFLLFIIFFINLASATENISLEYLEEINCGEEFYVNISIFGFNNDSYDVKVELFDSKDNTTRLSRTWDGNTWQSSNLYINELINTDFSNKSIIKINTTINSNISSNMQVKLRNSKNEIYVFSGYNIKLIERKINKTSISENLTEEEGQDEEENEEIEVSIDFQEEDIINSEEFELEISAINLLDKNYDAKIYIYDDDKDKPLSQVYDEDKEAWISSIYYLKDFLKGPGEDNNIVKLKIKEDYKDYSGSAVVGIKLRESGESSILLEKDEDIEIKEYVEQENDEDEIKEYPKIENNKKIPENNIIEKQEIGNVIYLDKNNLKTETIKSLENKIYESKNNRITKYSMYSFSLLLTVFVSVLIFLKIK
jgi:hypothetical protein